MTAPLPHASHAHQQQSQTTLYVRGLPTATREDEVLTVFQNYGQVKDSRFQKNKETGEFIGWVLLLSAFFFCSFSAHSFFCALRSSLLLSSRVRTVFIEYQHASAAKLAQIQMNEKPWGDRTVLVDFANERASGSGGTPKQPPVPEPRVIGANDLSHNLSAGPNPAMLQRPSQYGYQPDLALSLPSYAHQVNQMAMGYYGQQANSSASSQQNSMLPTDG